MLMMPAALKTQTEVSGAPVVAGPRATITRLATTAAVSRLTVENGGACVPAYEHVPLGVVGKTLRKVCADPLTPPMFKTAAAAFVPGMASAPVPVTLTTSGTPACNAPCDWQGVVGTWVLVSHTRIGAMEWNSPVGSLAVSGSKYPSTSATTSTDPCAL